MTPRDKLLEQGYSWEEADERLQAIAEEQADAERDRQAEEYFATDDERSNDPRK